MNCIAKYCCNSRPAAILIASFVAFALTHGPSAAGLLSIVSVTSSATTLRVKLSTMFPEGSRLIA